MSSDVGDAMIVATRGGLLHPSGEVSFVELVVLADVEVARVLVVAGAGRGAQLCRFTISGTHTGTYGGVQPFDTGQSLYNPIFSPMAIARLRCLA